MKVAKKSAINDVVILKTKQKVHFLKKNNKQRLLERTLGSRHTNDIIMHNLVKISAVYVIVQGPVNVSLHSFTKICLFFIFEKQ